MASRVKRLGVVVRDLRKERGWTQAELAKRAKVSYFYVTNLETRVGVPRRLDRLEQIAGALDSTLGDLLAAAGLVAPVEGDVDWRKVVNGWPLTQAKKRALIALIEEDMPEA